MAATGRRLGSAVLECRRVVCWRGVARFEVVGDVARGGGENRAALVERAQRATLGRGAPAGIRPVP